MSADVEMSSSAPSSGRHFPSPHHHSPIVVDDPDPSVPSHSPAVPPHPSTSSPSASSAPGAAPSKSAVATIKENGKKSKPSSSAAAAPNAATAGAKSKSTKPPRSPSPSPPPPPVRPPLQTVRLDIKLGGQDNYAVDIAALAKDTGQRASTPVPVAKPDSSDDSHSEGDDDGEEDKAQTKKKRKRRNPAAEYYDVSDPFIDDSELTKDERTFFAETKQQGFYVSSGQVALQHNAPQAKKPKSRKVNILAPAASVSAALATLPASLAPLSLNGASASSSKLPPPSPRKVSVPKAEGTRDAPISLEDDDKANLSALKRKATNEGDASVSVNGASTASTSKKKRRVEIRPFHPDLQAMIEQLKLSIAVENFEQKGKFPPALKPFLGQVALKAIVLGEYDDNFFNVMPTLFPYNKFTMTKLIKRTIWRDHMNLLTDRQNACLEKLAQLAQEGFPKAKEEYEKSLAQWERRQEKAKQDAEAGPSSAAAGGQVAASAEGTPVPSDAQPTPKAGTSSLPDGHESEHEGEGGAGGAGGPKNAKDAHPPTKKYRLTEDMKALIWQLVCLSNECCRIENEKNTLEANNQVVSEQGVRKNLYQKIVAAFPEGWLSSGQISRDVSVMKKKYEKDAMED
ncbi:hypothetical protein BXZ70DRAFT_1010874 [Cristinia sonorae]|uniref:Ubinuclein middle domain-containing protein n=1 Tax=Cristinia sonorae TaxID=1940300 RepID=A0A8K0XLX8_9AGAR|nr:hypothetical protein BXZ70DRAFT_1010874 [Cristinia sonorae]